MYITIYICIINILYIRHDEYRLILNDFRMILDQTGNHAMRPKKSDQSPGVQSGSFQVPLLLLWLKYIN